MQPKKAVTTVIAEPLNGKNHKGSLHNAKCQRLEKGTLLAEFRISEQRALPRCKVIYHILKGRL